jgi:outer membrane protein OmpA-like peptidoglycan-associated protein
MRSTPLVAMAGLSLLACPAQDSGTLPPPIAAPTPPPRGVYFANQSELLEAIADGSFAERVGLTETLEAATPESLPPPVKIEFVSGTGVPDDQQEELRELAALLKANEQLRVDIVGCSDPSGAEALNLRLSEARAQSVASRIRELGVAPEQIGDVVGKGETCQVQERAVNVVPAFREAESGRAGEASSEE